EKNKKISVNGYKWDILDADDYTAQAIMQSVGVPYIVAKILATRGINSVNADIFLNPKLQTLLPNPSCLKDMDKAAQRLAQAIINKEKIGIIGDYDVDGATSSAILRKFLEFFKLDVSVHIPNRDEGYGPSTHAFEKFKSYGIKTVVTTDCGTSAFDVLNQAASEGFDIIVLDHHEAEICLPKVHAVVNPKRLDEANEYPYLKYMAAVGVVFIALVAINRELKNLGYYNVHKAPDLLSLLDLVALGTVCDVVPLIGLNRAYVKQGLKIMSLRQNLGIKALCDIAKIDRAPTAYHLGYVLGPRINAGGRVGDPSIGNKLLCCVNDTQAKQMAQELNQFNDDRKKIEEEVLSQAIAQVECHNCEYPLIFVAGKNWHQGVIGIVAGKLKERYNLPSFVMSVEEDEVKGSARSINGVDLGALVISAKEQGVLTKGGGHTMAAGFSLNEDKIDDFKKFVGNYIQNKLNSENIVPVLTIDAVVSLSGVNEKLADCLQLLEPFGSSNPEPKIMIERVMVKNAIIVGNGHIKCKLVSDMQDSLNAIIFKAENTPMGNVLKNAGNDIFNIVGVLRKDTWQGKNNLQFIIEDIMRC
ncbi:MAG: single-stranded-DNA-specific exonuclease RecJ, partial [Alphaproteobacteria bacterium]|nr:single-stranded-DNA-specific exonuclease RecJ [Alphaproteobacteria bacterium]